MSGRSQLVRRSTATAATAVLLLLAGCGGGDGADGQTPDAAAVSSPSTDPLQASREANRKAVQVPAPPMNAPDSPEVDPDNNLSAERAQAAYEEALRVFKAVHTVPGLFLPEKHTREQFEPVVATMTPTLQGFVRKNIETYLTSPSNGGDGDSTDAQDAAYVGVASLFAISYPEGTKDDTVKGATVQAQNLDPDKGAFGVFTIRSAEAYETEGGGVTVTLDGEIRLNVVNDSQEAVTSTTSKKIELFLLETNGKFALDDWNTIAT